MLGGMDPRPDMAGDDAGPGTPSEPDTSGADGARGTLPAPDTSGPDATRPAPSEFDEPPATLPGQPGMLLRTAASWSWRLLLVVAAIIVFGTIVSRLRLVVIPLLAGILLTALLHPAVALLRRWRLGRLTSAWLVLIGLFIVVAGVLTLFGTQATSEFQDVGKQVSKGIDQLQGYLTNGPFHFKKQDVDNFFHNIRGSFSRNQNQVVSGVVHGASLAVEVAAGTVLTIFVTFFLLYDGDRVWRWIATRFPENAGARVAGAGAVAWLTISGYIRGTAIVAFVDALGVGIALIILGTPLAFPLTLLIFFGAFIPLIGAVITGTAAVLVALVTQGIASAIAVLVAIVLVNQLESHILQPLLMGRAVRLHPMAIALSLTAGTALWGIAGGVVAVPFAAVLNRVSSYLSNEAPPLGTPSPYRGLHAPQKQKRRRLAAVWRAVRGRPAPPTPPTPPPNGSS